MDYSRLLHSFIEKLTTDQQKSVEAKGLQNVNVHATFETGRKFDKIKIRMSPTSPNGTSSGLTTAPEVRFFVDKKTGIIYGAKSKNAPNLKWYFGTLETASLWDWSDYHPTPVNDTSVRAIKRYGPFITYVPA